MEGSDTASKALLNPATVVRSSSMVRRMTSHSGELSLPMRLLAPAQNSTIRLVGRPTGGTALPPGTAAHGLTAVVVSTVAWLIPPGTPASGLTAMIPEGPNAAAVTQLWGTALLGQN